MRCSIGEVFADGIGLCDTNSTSMRAKIEKIALFPTYYVILFDLLEKMRGVKVPLFRPEMNGLN